MKSHKRFLAVAVAGALTAATAVPALALENEFHGAFTSFYDLSNYSAVGNGGDSQAPDALKTGLSKDAPTENYFVQRVRLLYNAKASDNVKLVTKFEMDYKFWGNSSYTTARNSGGALGADSVNLETKNLYLDLTFPTVVNTRIGMQSYYDSFKGVLFDADMAGLLFSHDYSKASVAVGYFRWDDSAAATLGKSVRDMFSLDAKINISKDVKVGAAYYYIDDHRSKAPTVTTTSTPNGVLVGYTPDGTPIFSLPPTVVTTTTPNPANGTKVSTIGINAEGVVGPVTVNGFVLKQFGDLDAVRTARGYALNAGARMKIGKGTARSEFLYVSGGKHAFYTAENGAEGGGFYDNELVILGRDKNSLTIYNAIVFDVANSGQGVIVGSLGYDQTFTDKLTASVNAGFAAVAYNPTAAKSDYLGTETNAEVGYKLTPNVNLSARAGYVFLGDYFKASPSLDNPYDLKIIAKYNF
jgi:hypothetical protein